MKKFKIHLLLLLLISSASQAQKGLGLPVWPLVTASPEYLQKEITNYTPHEVVDWRGTSPSWTTIPGTAPTKGADNWAPSQAGFDDCGNMVFYVLHTGNLKEINALELYMPDGTLLLGTGTSPSAPSGHRSDGETQVVKRPGYSNQWYFIYNQAGTDETSYNGSADNYAYTCTQVLYSLIEVNGKEASYVTIGSEIQKDIALVAPPRETSPICKNDISVTVEESPRLYVMGKAVSRKSKTIGFEGHDLYLHRRYEGDEIPDQKGKGREINNNEFSIDRFEISKDGISWSSNSGKISSYGWRLGSSGSVIELGPFENKLAVTNRTQEWYNSLYLFNLKESNSNSNPSCKFLDNNPERIIFRDLYVVPDEDNKATTKYNESEIKNYKTVSSLASSNTYLAFLSEFQDKLSHPQFSPDGKKIYVAGGGYVQAYYGNLTYLCQIDLENPHPDGGYLVRLQIETVLHKGVDSWETTNGRQTNRWKGASSNNTTNKVLIDTKLNWNAVTKIQAAYDGNLYFTKGNQNKLFVIPTPNEPMPVNLIPRKIDLSTESVPNIQTNGFVLYPPDQIDGFNYLNSNYITVDIPFEYKTKQETDNGCELVCSAIDLSLQDQDGNIIAESTINDCGVFTVCVRSSKNYRFKLVGNGMEFDDVIVGGVLKTPPNSDFFNFTTDNCNPVPCEECKTSFSPQPGREYLLSAWVKEEYTDLYPDTYKNSGVQITFNNGADDDLPIFKPTGPIIDGWQRIEQSFVVPYNAENIQINLKNLSDANNAYFDDVRVHTFSGNMKSYVYDPSTQKLTAELDENNYATKYEYDDEGILIRVKKETTRGVMTIKESRNNQSKINK